MNADGDCKPMALLNPTGSSERKGNAMIGSMPNTPNKPTMPTGRNMNTGTASNVPSPRISSRTPRKNMNADDNCKLAA